MENGHNNCVFYGRGKSYSRSDCERLWRQLVVDGVLAEKLFVTAQDHTVCYMELGRKAQDVLQGKLKVRCIILLMFSCLRGDALLGNDPRLLLSVCLLSLFPLMLHQYLHQLSPHTSVFQQVT